MEITKVSKRHPVPDDRTGPEAATIYRLRHNRGIDQCRRAERIAAGLRPLKYAVLSRADRLHIVRAAKVGFVSVAEALAEAEAPIEEVALEA